MEQFSVKSVGVIKVDKEGMRLVLRPRYAPALAGLVGFGSIEVLWWFSKTDNAACRNTLVEEAPYKKGPQTMGVFATRSPQRPNPIALSCAQITYIDEANATIGLAHIDADDGSPVLDIKPYTPSLDRVEHPEVPQWCAHWPKSTGESGAFNWAAEFNF